MTPLLLRARDRTLELAGSPVLMGIVNATPDSFSDARRLSTTEERVEHARALVADGAGIIDIGGESGVTDTPAVGVAEEIARVVPVVERVAAELDVLVSVDTYKPPVAEAAIAAGAHIVNDVSGLRDRTLADVCARTGAALVVMHTRAAPKEVRFDGELDGRAVSEVVDFLRERMALAVSRGVPAESIVLDPGPDFTKTPAQTLEILRDLGPLLELGRPLLMAISRKDFIGAITARRPADRLAGTLAALGEVADQGAHIARVHDVGAAADFLAVRAALRGETELPRETRIDPALRWER
jgi:dihydropteroate synthase